VIVSIVLSVRQSFKVCQTAESGVQKV